MNNATISWGLPTVRESGLPLAIENIAEVQVSMSADLGVTWASLASVLPLEAQESFVADLAPGEWRFKIVVIDTAGRPSAPVEISGTVLDDSAPGPVTNAAVSLS